MPHCNSSIEQVSVQSLKPYPRNARRHSKVQIKQIAASIERFGFNNPILVADDGEIVAGHGRLHHTMFRSMAMSAALGGSATGTLQWARER